MPATHKIEVFKSFAGENWGNVYLIENAGLVIDLVPTATVIYEAEQTFHSDAVLFEYARISTIEPNDGFYTTVPIGLPGSRLVAGMVPLFVTARADILVNGGGRPSRKYYRGVLGEEDMTATTVSSGVLNDIVSALTTAFIDAEALSTPICDPQGQKWQTVTGYPKPQMRQLHRKRKKAAGGSSGFG